MRKFTAILQTNKEPKDTNALWYHKGALKYYGNNGWELFNDIHPEDIPISIDSIPEAKNLKEVLNYLEKQAQNYRVVQSVQDLEGITHESPGSVTDGTRAYVTDTKDYYVYNSANDIWVKDDSNRFTSFKILAPAVTVLSYNSSDNSISFDKDMSIYADSTFIMAIEDQNYKCETAEDLSYCTIALDSEDNTRGKVIMFTGNQAIPYAGTTGYIIYSDRQKREIFYIPIITVDNSETERGIYVVKLKFYTINVFSSTLEENIDLLDFIFNMKNIQESHSSKIYKLEQQINSLDYLKSLYYGVNIRIDQLISRIGDTELNNTLPIQNGMKGCIVKIKDGKADIQYYLNQDDFRWYDTEYVLNTTEDMDYTIIDESKGTFTVTLHTDLTSDDPFNPNRIKGAWVHSLNKKTSGEYTCECLITDIDTSTNKITLQPKEVYSLETLKAEMNDEFYLGSVLNGYDGEVMIEVPSFYLKGFKTDEYNYDVRVSPYFIDSSWEHQPRILVSAFCNTVLNEVPEDMGYLSTLPVGAAISVVNTGTYCRGGNNDATYDSNLGTYPFSTNLGKPRTNLSRSEMRECARLGGKEVMSYLEYKRIFHWLWVIEFASLETKNDLLMSGICNIPISAPINFKNSFPLYPNGYILNHPGIYKAYYKDADNESRSHSISGFGSNKSFIIDMDGGCSLFNNGNTAQYDIRPMIWHGFENPCGNILLNVDGIVLDGTDSRDSLLVYITDNPELYGESTKGMDSIALLSTANTEGYTYIGNFVKNVSADIIPGPQGSTYGYHWYNGVPKSTAMRTGLFGAYATQSGNYFYMRNFYSNSDINRANIEIGFRTVFVLDK